MFGVAGIFSFSEPFECLKYAAKNEEIDWPNQQENNFVL